MLHVFLTLNNLADPCLEKSRLVLDRTVLRSEADSQMHKDHQPPGFPAWSACSDHSVARASWSRMVPARKDRQHPEIFHRSSPGCWPVTVNLRGPSDVRRKRSHLAAPIMHGSPGAWQLGPVRASTNPPWITRVFSVILSFLRKSPRLVQRTLVGSLRP